MAQLTVDFVVTGDPQRAQATVVTALAAAQFRLTWESPWSGVAERGNKTMNFLFGAFAQYFKVDMQLTDAGDGRTVVRVVRSNSGAMGGVAGVARIRKQFAAVASALEHAFRGAGVLVARNDIAG
ncbi:MAG: hypothetical protein FWD74_03810 [Actinomycetia bacterium]|nr:hypothetical protein [Actinomycetes bacterium]